VPVWAVNANVRADGWSVGAGGQGAPPAAGPPGQRFEVLAALLQRAVQPATLGPQLLAFIPPLGQLLDGQGVLGQQRPGLRPLALLGGCIVGGGLAGCCRLGRLFGSSLVLAGGLRGLGLCLGLAAGVLEGGVGGVLGAATAERGSQHLLGLLLWVLDRPRWSLSVVGSGVM